MFMFMFTVFVAKLLVLKKEGATQVQNNATRTTNSRRASRSTDQQHHRQHYNIEAPLSQSFTIISYSRSSLQPPQY